MAQPTKTNTDAVEDDNVTGGLNSFPVALLVLIASPLTVVSALLTYMVFAVGKVKTSVILGFGLLPSLIMLAFFWESAVRNFMEAFTVTVPSMVSQNIEIFPGIIEFLSQQALLSVPLGIAFGLGYSAYRWYTRPVWVETVFRLTPLEWFRKRKNIKDIRSDKNTPYDGMTLGVSDRGEKIVQTFRESVAHTVVFGASGAGKTKTLLSRARDAMKNGQGMVVVDLKGSKDLAEDIAVLAERYDKKFQHWVFHPTAETYSGPALNGPAYYDPIGRGEATRRKDLLIEARTWSEEYYKNEASFFLQLVMSVIVANPIPGKATLSDVIELLNPLALQKRAIPLGTNPLYADLVRQVDALNDEKMEAGRKSAVSSLSSQLGVLLNSVAGPWLKTDPTGSNNIDLFRAAQEGEIVVFTLDSSNYGMQASLIANLIIQDLKTVSSELRVQPAPEPFQVIIDEFSAVGSENIIGLVNKSRDANMPVTLTTQALADLRQHSPTLQDQLLGIVNSFIIHRANKFDDAEELAGLSGKIIRKRFNEAVTYKTGFLSRGSAVGTGTIEDVEEPTILPQDIQSLGTGEFYYINKNPMRVVHGNCIIEDPSMIKVHDTSGNVNFVEAPVFEEAEAPDVTMDGYSTQLTSPPVTPSFTVPEVRNGSQVLTPPNSSPIVNPSTTKPGVHERADRGRLREIFNQDPDEFLPRNTRTDEYDVVTMPPRVSPELPKTPSPSRAPSGLPQLPTIPSLPPKSDGIGNGSASSTAPSGLPQLPSFNKNPKVSSTPPADFPQLPGLPPKSARTPVSKPAPTSTSKPKEKEKDEFDF